MRAWLGLTVAALALAVPTVASAAPGNGKGNDVLYVGKDVKVKKPKKGELPQAAPLAAAVAEAADEFESPPVGSTKIWPLINFVTGSRTSELFTLRAVSARRSRSGSRTTSDFPAGDCRNDGVRNVITDAQVDVPRRPVRREHVPEDVGGLQLAAAARRHGRDPARALESARRRPTTRATATRSSPSSRTSATRTTPTSRSRPTSRATTRATSTPSSTGT